MTVQNQSEQTSPWRRLFEDVRRAAANRRDEHGVRGSINWLRKQMESRGANPNVVRNIIYRDKGRAGDKQVLFEILRDLWGECEQTPLRAPEIEVLLSQSGGTETEVVRLLGREKRRAYRAFVGGVHSGAYPKLLVTGRPGSGKTLLIDYIQEALEVVPGTAERVVRLEFGYGHLATSLTRLAVSVGVPSEVVESKLAKIGASGAFAVQADAQAEVARVILEAIRASDEPLVLLAHVSRAAGSEERLGNIPLRLNTAEVPRVSAAEWLWLTLFDPLSRLPSVALLVSMTDMPARTMMALGAFDEPVRLNPPTISEARRFVRARLPHLDAKQQELVVRRAGRSFEELRTLTLLAEMRAPLPGNGGPPPTAGGDSPEPASMQHLAQLGALVKSAGDERLRDFLAALAALSLAEFPTFAMAALRHVRTVDDDPSSLELAFLDPVPPDPDRYRPFSREFARHLRKTLLASDPEWFRRLSGRAAEYYRAAAESDPVSEEASRHLHHLFHARDWASLSAWIECSGLRQSLIRPLWNAAQSELDGELFERIAYQVASYYVRLGAYGHPEANRAFAALEASSNDDLRAWALIQRAEGAVLRGQVERAQELLAACPADGDSLRHAEAALVRASIARWRSQLDEAAALVEEVARPRLAQSDTRSRAGRVASAKAAVWAGLIAKDRGDLESALGEFSSVEKGDELVEARVAFQRGDVLLSLGRFDAALRALDEAVNLARVSHALIPEQTRYLSRRGTLHRKRGDLGLAKSDLESARAIIVAADDPSEETERTFWLARCEDERALALLAEGEFQQAILVLQGNLSVFQNYARHLGVEADYRMLRGTLRLGRAYLFRALGQPYRLPFSRTVDDLPASADLLHARRLVASVRRALAARQGRLHWPLQRDALQLTSLLSEDPGTAAAEARCALEEARYPYQAAESRGYLALAHLRARDADSALAEIAEANAALARVVGPDERSDLGLRAWLAALTIRAGLRAGASETAASSLASLLRDETFAEFHQPLLRIFGEAVECSGSSDALHSPSLAGLLDVDGGLVENRIRLPDALDAWWLARSRPLARESANR
jgi:tetratricopeptide (TPR) repeat protein